MEVAEVSNDGACRVTKISLREWRRCVAHFETELLEICAKNTRVRDLYEDASKVHPFAFPATFNRYLVPRDAVIRAKNGLDLASAVKQSLVDLQKRGKLLPTDAGYVTKDSNAVEFGEHDAVDDEDDPVDDDADDHDADEEHDSALEDDDVDGDDDIVEDGPIADEDWYGGSVGTA